MRRHVDIGVALIRDVPELDEVLAAVGCHHEHIDGSGYPHGLKGDASRSRGRILAVADAYSAMMSFRPYRRAHTTQEEAERELRSDGRRHHWTSGWWKSSCRCAGPGRRRSPPPSSVTRGVRRRPSGWRKKAS